MGLTRRAFLQRTGLALTAGGFSDLGLSLLTDRYQRVLAQPTRRKLALLIGINQYPEQVCDYVPNRGNALNGCLTDVELQQELLIHRFGVQPSDILTLTDQQATRKSIEEGFLSHLTRQARDGDVVLIHFSGLGSRMRLADAPDELRYSLVPVDGVLPTEENPAINDVLEETLGLLLRSLSTDQITTVLDVSYADSGKAIQGNLRVRSRPSTPTGQPNPAELALQEQLLNQVRMSRDQIRSEWRSGQLPGIVLNASESAQAAFEGQWAGVSAGLLTYTLTQHLWQHIPPTTLRVSFSRTASAINQFVGGEQRPRLSGQKLQESSLIPYHLPNQTAGADGVVTAVEEDGKTVRLWLGGLPAPLLEYYGANSLLSLEVAEHTSGEAELPVASGELDGTAAPPHTATLQVRSRDGLVLQARLLDTLTVAPHVGQVVRETVRTLPRNLDLVVALDTSLERIERVDATSAFAAIPKVSAVVAGEQPADYLFGKTKPLVQTVTASLPVEKGPDATVAAAPANPDPPPKGSYGLFNLGRTALPMPLIQGDEAVKTAVNRLTPQLRTLLATKLLRLTSSAGSSRLGVRAMLEMVVPQERIVAQLETGRAPWTSPDSKLARLFAATDGGVPVLPIGSRIRYRLLNYSDRPVYFIVLGLDSGSNAIALSPPQMAAYNPAPDNLDAQATQATEYGVAPGASLVVPQVPPAPEWVINGPPGLAETHIIFSRTPLLQTATALDASSPLRSAYRVSVLSNPLEVAHAVLQDLHQASTAAAAKPDLPIDTYTLNVDTWATLSFVYRVTDG